MAQATPFQNPSGVVKWRVQFRIDGKGRQETFETPKEAEVFASSVNRVGGKAARQLLESRNSRTATTFTLTEWVDKYLDPASGMLTGVEPSTRADYRRIAARSFLPMLGDIPIDEVSRDDIGAWVAWQEKQPKSRYKNGVVVALPRTKLAAKTIRNYHALLSNLFKAAVERNLRVDNPAKRVRVSEGVSKEAVFLSREEFARLYNEIPDYYKPLVAFLVGSQVRWSEATALQWRHLNTDTLPPTVRVHQAWKKPAGDEPSRISVTKTKMGRRTVSLWPELVAILGTPTASNDFIFQGRQNHDRLWYGMFRARAWDPAVQRAGLTQKPTPHDLRHTGASWLIADGKPLPYIQARLGHEDIRTTVNVYGHLLPDAHTEMADSLASTLSHVIPILTREVPRSIRA